jgi:hypothetical protein
VQLANEIAINVSRPIFDSNKDVQVVLLPLIQVYLSQNNVCSVYVRKVRKPHNRDIPLNYEILISQWVNLKKMDGSKGEKKCINEEDGRKDKKKKKKKKK